MKIFNPYILICVDILVKSKSNPKNKNKDINDLKFYFVVFMSLLMSLNLFVIIHSLENFIIKVKFYNFQFDYFEGNRLDYIISYFVLYFLPPSIINIFTINYILKINDLSKYKYFNGRLSLFYIVASYVVFISYLIFLAIKNSN
jgi:hypothetical protein